MERDGHLYTEDGRPLVRLSFLDELVEGSRRMAERLPETARPIKPGSVFDQIRKGGRRRIREIR